jgi:two-component system response regulator HydG
MKQHILIVDDEAAVCKLLSNYFTRHGYETLTCGTVGEGQRLVDEQPFTLVILDIALPDGDGLKLLGSIKEAHPDLPVIMMTGMGWDPELMEEAMRKKASAYVVKTLPLSQLLMEIRRVLKGSG